MSNTHRPQKEYIKYYDDHIDLTASKGASGIPDDAFDVVKTETVWTMFDMIRKVSPTNKFLGTRQYDAEKKAYTEYKFINYQEGYRTAVRAANSFMELGMKENDIVSLCMGNRAHAQYPRYVPSGLHVVASPCRA